MPNISELFYIGAAVLKTTVDTVTATILAQIGSIVDEYVFSDSAEWFQHVGLASRPANPIKGKSAAECVAIRGSRDTIIASRDVRGQQIYGNLNEGETCLYASGADGQSQGRVLIKGDGSVTLYTTDSNTPSGNTVALRISPSGGLEFTSQWGSMVLDQTGFHVKTAAGPRIDMGGISIPGVPSVVTGAFAGYANITAPSVQLAGANVVLGMGPIFGQGVLGNPALLIGGGPIPLSMADVMTSALFAANTVWISQ